MHPFEIGGRGAEGVQLAADPILDRLDIVIGAGLDLLDRRDVRDLRVLRHGFEPITCFARQPRQSLVRRPGGESQEPRTFDANSFAHQARFAE